MINQCRYLINLRSGDFFKKKKKNEKTNRLIAGYYLINKMINVCPKKETPDSTVLERLKCGFLRL